MRQGLSLCFIVFSIAFAAACGGGGGGGGGQSRSDMLYVRQRVGDDSNTGTSPTDAFQSIARAAGLATDGDTIIVGPGTYGRVDIDRLVGTSQQPVLFLADPTGFTTGDPPGPVIVDAALGFANQDERIFGFRLSRSPYIVLDGFEVVNARSGPGDGVGIHVRGDSDNVIVRNCIVRGNRDGIRVQIADNVTLFNNLIVDNVNRGLRIANGSDSINVINNTIADNGNQGLVLGDEDQASVDAFLTNNIIQNNRNRNIFVVTGTPPSSLDGYDADYNLVFSEEVTARDYTPSTIVGPHDINQENFDVPDDLPRLDAAFVGNGDYHLQQDVSPAVDASTPGLGGSFRTELAMRTTSVDGTLDSGRPDLGYHYPIVE